MVGTLVIQPPKGMSLEEAKTALKMLKFKILLEDTSEVDPTKMSKEEYFAIIDKARAEKKTKASKQELVEMLYQMMDEIQEEYTFEYSKRYALDIELHKKSGQKKILEKIALFLEELSIHPKEELINKDFFEEEPHNSNTPTLIDPSLFFENEDDYDEKPTKEATEVTDKVFNEALRLKKLIEEGKIRLNVPMPADVSPFDDEGGLDVDEDNFVATPMGESDSSVVTAPLDIIDFDANANLEGDFEYKKEFAKEMVAKVLEELGLETPNFEAYIKYFIDRLGKKATDDLFPGLVKFWELAGYSLDDVNTVYNKFFNTAAIIADAALELMNSGTLVEKSNQDSENTTTDTGQIEPLKGYGERNVYSYRIDKKHHLIYEVFEEEKRVDLLAAYGHYDEEKSKKK